ncbi:hypothetical protein SAMN05660733_07956 [Lentzea albidocapillata]|uniref:Uncharacterized protein n=1 Tax=Lentzea albidocapillata TaxID=40571 RepID=A0A1W2FSH8_9PSEU|nr:hypothetical protein SAMN05660733_07956 [Lentzea albidocapillata]
MACVPPVRPRGSRRPRLGPRPRRPVPPGQQGKVDPGPGLLGSADDSRLDHPGPADRDHPDRSPAPGHRLRIRLGSSPHSLGRPPHHPQGTDPVALRNPQSKSSRTRGPRNLGPSRGTSPDSPRNPRRGRPSRHPHRRGIRSPGRHRTRPGSPRDSTTPTSAGKGIAVRDASSPRPPELRHDLPVPARTRRPSPSSRRLRHAVRNRRHTPLPSGLQSPLPSSPRIPHQRDETLPRRHRDSDRGPSLPSPSNSRERPRRPTVPRRRRRRRPARPLRTSTPGRRHPDHLVPSRWRLQRQRRPTTR